MQGRCVAMPVDERGRVYPAPSLAKPLSAPNLPYFLWLGTTGRMRREGESLPLSSWMMFSPG